ncbi:DNA-directed DNA polymerase IV Ecym_1342 [Eremothecium cymbalariae DBVPG|uniref:DNA polymerase n=1 Tax=Eremothecium cymbalariae (strain CBS 270.75 / DBVPG 7215 / KCTC 17166 / NRRL Y-17582) TaxID=931890 RepID=G8JNB2_ERECY|nr:hypothetical protein Ecym_1342 [Eremothecium cymbalariae DBVPG\
MFKGHKFVILPTSRTPKCRVVAGLIEKHGGEVVGGSSEGGGGDHVIYLIQDSYLNAGDEVKNMEVFRLESDVDLQRLNWDVVRPVRLSWVSECLKQGEMVCRDEFAVKQGWCGSSSKERRLSPDRKRRKVQETVKQEGQGQGQERRVEQSLGENVIISEALQRLATKSNLQGEPFKRRAYMMASAALLECGHPVRTYEDALALPDVGSGIATKIAQLVANGGRIPGLELDLSEQEKILEYFVQCHEVGPTTASQWQALHYKSFKDVLTHTKQWNLHWSILYGMRFFEEWQLRMPRSEVEEHLEFIRKHAQPGLVIEAMGSYRRGRKDCGDIDLLVYREGCEDVAMLSQDLEQLVRRLVKVDYIVCPLQLSEALQPLFASQIRQLLQNLGVEYSGRFGDGKMHLKKFYCAVRLPGSHCSATTLAPVVPYKDIDKTLFAAWSQSEAHPHRCRRLDLLCCKWSEIGAHRLYFTGDDELNKTMRTRAAKQNMNLNQHGLFYRDSEACIESFDEYRIMQLLGIPKLVPTERSRVRF